MKDLNILPNSLLEKRKLKKKIIYKRLYTSGVVFLVILTIFMPYTYRIKKEFERNSLKKYVTETSLYPALQTQTAIVSSLLKERQVEAEKLSKIGINISPIINKIEKTAPNGVSLTGLTINNETKEGKITLAGKCVLEKDVAEFVSKLREDKTFKSVDLMSFGSSTSSTENNTKNIQGLFYGKKNEAFEFKVIAILANGV